MYMHMYTSLRDVSPCLRTKIHKRRVEHEGWRGITCLVDEPLCDKCQQLLVVVEALLCHSGVEIKEVDVGWGGRGGTRAVCHCLGVHQSVRDVKVQHARQCHCVRTLHMNEHVCVYCTDGDT